MKSEKSTSCRYHKSHRCPKDCPMREVFPKLKDDVQGAYATLHRIMGGFQVLLRFFQSVNTIEERLVVARALHWSCKCWFLYPTGGPLEAFRLLQAEVNKIAGPETAEPPVPPGYNYVSELDDVVVPFVLFGPRPEVTLENTMCLYHYQLGDECPVGCILRPVFSPNSCEFSFRLLYDRYGGTKVIPRHFTGYADLNHRTGIANSLMWEGAEWSHSPAGGPMLAYGRLLRRLVLLRLNQNLPLQVRANAAGAVGSTAAAADTDAELLHEGVVPTHVPQFVCSQGGREANLQLVVADPLGPQPQEGNVVFGLDGAQPFVLQVGGGAKIQLLRKKGDGLPSQLLLQVVLQPDGDEIEMSYADGAIFHQEEDDQPLVQGADVVDGVDGTRPFLLQVGGGGMIKLFLNIGVGDPPQLLLQVVPQLGGLQISVGDSAYVLQVEDLPVMQGGNVVDGARPFLVQVGVDGGVQR